MARNHSKRRNAGDTGEQRQKRDKQRPARSGGGEGGGPAWLWGTHAVLAALANPSRQRITLLATENAARRAGLNDATLVTAKDLGHRLPDGAVHQGLALQVEPLQPLALEELAAGTISRVAVLDQVSDPHNLGAVYRTAAAFGFGALVMQTRNAPPITGVAAKSAAGAIETVREVRVVNVSRALDLLADAGFHTVGLAGDSSRSLADAVSGAPRLAIVLGAEGPGLRPAVAGACAETAKIPMAPDMESLNVSNAAAIAFYEATRGVFPAG